MLWYLLKGECKKLLKNCQLTSYAIIFCQSTLFSIIKLFCEENLSFCYSIMTLFSKITYFLSTLSRALKLTSL